MPKRNNEDPSKGRIQNFLGRFVDRDKGAIRLRTRERANGCFVIYLDTYVKGKRKCEAVNVDNEALYLVPENGRNDSINKTRNTKTWEQAKAIKAQRIIDLQNGQLGLSQTAERKNMEVLTYIARLRDDSDVSRHYSMLYLHFEAFTKGEKVTFAQVDKDFVIRFIDYLKDDAVSVDIRKKQRLPLAANTQVNILKRLSVVLSKAVKEKIIDSNPCLYLAPDDKPKRPKSKINYLTVEEVQRLIDTSCKWDTLKRAFLFCCSTGLRVSDVGALKWEDIRDDDFYGKAMYIKVKKTRNYETFPVPTPALHFLPERNDAKDDDRIFIFHYDSNVGRRLQEWVDAAGINKKIRFHSSRHTAATMNLSLGADIATVSKLLGHASIKTTEIYAKVIDESKKKAVALQDGIFKF